MSGQDEIAGGQGESLGVRKACYSLLITHTSLLVRREGKGGNT